LVMIWIGAGIDRPVKIFDVTAHEGHLDCHPRDASDITGPLAFLIVDHTGRQTSGGFKPNPAVRRPHEETKLNALAPPS
jgi:hypothetical protein